MTLDRREIKRAFKERKTAKGVFAVRCRASGESWVSSSRDMDSSRTGVWFMLRNDSHHNTKMQASWRTHGPDSFEFEVLETFDPELAPLLLDAALRDRQKHWARELNASMV